jgi:hypothetical protein
MKFIFILFSIWYFSSLSIQAQTLTGGKPDVDFSDSIKKIDILMIVNDVNNQWPNCITRKVSIKGLHDLYSEIKLQIILNNFGFLKTNNENCVDKNNIIPERSQFDCLFTPDSRIKIRGLVKDPDFSSYLQRKQSFTFDEAVEFIKFLKDLDSTSSGL